MKADEFLELFRRLEPRERRSVLIQLPNELHRLESSLLRQEMDTIDLRADIVGLLPPELVDTVFSHLDHKAPFRLQAVRTFGLLHNRTEHTVGTGLS